MIRTAFRILTAVVVVICLAFLGYRLIDYWQKHQKRKELFVYIQSKSPVTQRMPSETIFYLNAFDLSRVHSDIQGSAFYDVFSHWLDTGMAKNQEANPVMGGMMEKALLNVIGKEFGLGVVPSKTSIPDLFAVAELAPGSDFLLKLALAGNKDAEKIEFKDDVIYSFSTKTPEYPDAYVYVGERFAFATNNLDLLVSSLKEKSQGPRFLSEIPAQAVPEDAFLFAASSNPRIVGFASGNNRTYHFRFSSDSQVISNLPEIEADQSTVLKFQTNVTAVIKKPAVTYLLSSVEKLPVSLMLLNFSDRKAAKQQQRTLFEFFQRDNPIDTLHRFSLKGVTCYTKSSDDVFCASEVGIIFGQYEKSLLQASVAHIKPLEKRSLPLLLKVEFHRAAIDQYFQWVKEKSWNRFHDAKAFYFLSCLKSLENGDDENQITLELL